MTPLKMIGALLLAASVSACGSTHGTRNAGAPFEVLPEDLPAGTVERASIANLPEAPIRAVPDAALSVSDVRVTVPRSLSVSEANSYYPRADIVWRGDLIGDRHAQIETLMQNAFTTGTDGMAGPTPVIVDVKVVRFHSLTEKARYTIGGVHNMVFDLTVRKASDGEPLAPTWRVKADLPALGGKAAMAADGRGETQKVRVTAYLQQVIREELARFISG